MNLTKTPSSGIDPNYTDVVIDLYHWNQNIDFKSVKEDGIYGVIHKYTEGSTYIDKTYKEREQLASEADLICESYHFASGVDGTE
ncbi:MAG: GH25 family lysozyme [Flavobacteriales bacterium]